MTVERIERIFASAKFFYPTEAEPTRVVITDSKDAIVVAWQVEPGQTIPAHTHPGGQDTWTILTGSGDYCLDESGNTKPVVTGDVVVAYNDQIHGVSNNGNGPLRFISVISPADAGYHPVS